MLAPAGFFGRVQPKNSACAELRFASSLTPSAGAFVRRGCRSEMVFEGVPAWTEVLYGAVDDRVGGEEPFRWVGCDWGAEVVEECAAVARVAVRGLFLRAGVSR